MTITSLPFDTSKIERFLQTTLRQIKPSLPTEIAPEDDFKNDWGLDSLDLVEYVARIEQHFMIAVPDEDLEQMTSISAIINYLFAQTK